ncbi:13949_t:CDS:2 [Funneliformis mosseae]|uniref:13949_t:CDS:1 n=1 Tax=Funneliformis mosseae TaxID=27381 RepID=A0A9N8YT79_FUNMO|nr:13949_t:CDS:2 [Funneliformis mosseae]
MFWQLKFHPESKDHNEYCALWLIALPNPLEKYSSENWSDRSEYSVTYFMKNPNEKLNFGKLENYNARSPVWGFTKFCKKDRLPKEGEITIGVRFNKVKYETEKIATPLPSQPLPQDLLKAWKSELDQPEISDVQFNFNEGTLYARSTILIERSEYFKCMFQQDKWSESKFTTKSLIPSSTQITQAKSCTSTKRSWNLLDVSFGRMKKVEDLFSMYRKMKSHPSQPMATITSSCGNTCTIVYEGESSNSINVPKRYVVNVSDFHLDTFKSMLKFLYTNQIEFYSNSLHRRPLDIFVMADKYLITELRDRAKSKILKDLKPDSAAELLFSTEWLWPDVKDMIMSYVVRKWEMVRETDKFREILEKPQAYPNSKEIVEEIIERVRKNDEEKKKLLDVAVVE